MSRAGIFREPALSFRIELTDSKTGYIIAAELKGFLIHKGTAAACLPAFGSPEAYMIPEP